MYILAVGGVCDTQPMDHVFGFVFTPNPLPDKSQGFLSPLVSAPETFHVLLHFYFQFNQNKRSPKTGSEDVTDILLSNQTDWF